MVAPETCTATVIQAIATHTHVQNAKMPHIPLLESSSSSLASLSEERDLSLPPISSTEKNVKRITHGEIHVVSHSILMH